MANKVGLGWLKDDLDFRDHWAKVSPLKIDMPSAIDLRNKMPPIWNQGSLGSCTAQAVCALVQFTEIEQLGLGRLPSRRYVYFNTRALQGNTKDDTGASIRNSIKALFQQGACREALCKYSVQDFAVKPSGDAYKDGRAKALPNGSYQRVDQTLDDLKEQLANDNPIAFGFAVYSSFMSSAVKNSGIVPMPKRSESRQGGHAVVLAGYDDARRMFLVRNSWGTNWGQKGYCWMPYEFVTSREISSDFWTITKVRG